MENIETKNRFVELRAKGNSFSSIAETLGVSKQTLINWSKELKVEVSNLRVMEYDALLNQYKLSKEKKLECFGEMLQKIWVEMQNRDLTELSTDKLFTLYVKLNDSFEKDRYKVAFEGDEEMWTIKPEVITWEA